MPANYGMKFRELLSSKKHFLVIGASSPIEVLAMQANGFEMAYLSGAALSLKKGFLDEGNLSLEAVVGEVKDIVRVADIPLIVDCDTGLVSENAVVTGAYSELEVIEKNIAAMDAAGAAAVQIEDQVPSKKRCGHLPGKEVVSAEEMFWKLKIASRAKKDLALIARTDARSVSGLEEAIWRARNYIAAGADIVFPEALESLNEFREFRKKITNIPLIANLASHGRTPHSIHAPELFDTGYQIVLLPVPQRILFKKFEDILAEARSSGSLGRYLSSGEISSRDRINAFLKEHSKMYRK